MSRRPPTVPRAPGRSRLALVGKGTWTVLDQGLFAVSNFAVNVLLARWLSPEAYGAFTVAFVVFLLAGTVHGGLLVEPMLVYGPGRFRDRVPAYLRVLLAGHAAYAVAAGALLGLGAVGSVLAEAPALAASLGVLAVAQGAILFLWLMRRACYTVFRPEWAAWGGAAYLLLVIGGAVGLGAMGWLTGPAALALMGAGALVVGLGLAVRLGIPVRTPELALARRAWAVHRRYGRWAAGTGVLEWLHGALPFLVLPLVAGLAGSASFRALYNLAMPALQSLGALTVIAVPYFVRARAAGPSRLRAATRRVGLLLVGGASLYGLALGLFGAPVMEGLYRGQYAAPPPLRWLMALMIVVAAAGGVLRAALRAQERPKPIFHARLGAVAVAASAGTALVALFSVAGALASDLAARGAEAVLMARALRLQKALDRRASRTPLSSSMTTAPPTMPSLPADPLETNAFDAQPSGDGHGGRLRVLLSAFACDPGAGSEPGKGWGAACTTARHHDVWLLTYAGFRRTIEAELRARPVPGLRFVYYKLPFERRRHAIEGLPRTGLAEQVHYYLWQLGAARLARRLHARVGFDVSHHVSFAKYWAPCALAWVPAPLIWGPVGGGESAPPPFYPMLSRWGRHYEQARDLARAFAERDPLVRRPARRAALALATTEETAVRMRRLGAPRVEVRSAISLATEEIVQLGALPAAPEDAPIRFLSLGRLLAFKGYDLGLKAFAEALRMDGRGGGAVMSEAEYWIVGEGPERERLEQLAAALGVAERVRFPGWLARPEALAELGRAHVFVHPSLHESGGMVCLEALAARRPVICFDLGGPAVHVPHEAGLRVPARDPAQAVRDLAEAIYTLAADPALRQRMGAAGHAHVAARFDRERRIAEMAARYWEVAGRARPSRPDLVPDLVTPAPPVAVLS